MNDNLISRARLLRDPYFREDRYPVSHHLRMAIMEQPAVDAVSRGVVEQIMWERDTAMEQLKEHGIPFGGVAPDVVEVVRCKDCKLWDPDPDTYGNSVGPKGKCMKSFETMLCDDFCSYGDRRADDATD